MSPYTDNIIHAKGYHIPVLLQESVDALIHNEQKSTSPLILDLTFGGGGHSREILKRLPKEGKLFGFDQDEDAFNNIREDTFFSKDERFVFIHSNFRYISNWMRYYNVQKVDGIIADLGVSSHHFDDENRGFSFRYDAPLDMRMNVSAKLTAADILNTYEENRLADILYLYGELRDARKIARLIVKQREDKKILMTSDLLETIKPLFKGTREKKDTAKLFQALRIEVNEEMEALKDMLNSAIDLLSNKGRLVIITYHSLEDRIVKNFIKTGNALGIRQEDVFGRSLSPLKAVNNKVIVPSDEELKRNPRSRSAKMRIATIAE